MECFSFKYYSRCSDSKENLAEKPTIVLVEDDDGQAATYRGWLEEAGFNVELAGTAEVALRMVEINRGIYSRILTDFYFDEAGGSMTGSDLIVALAKLPKFALPIWLQSDAINDYDVEHLMYNLDKIIPPSPAKSTLVVAKKPDLECPEPEHISMLQDWARGKDITVQDNPYILHPKP